MRKGLLAAGFAAMLVFQSLAGYSQSNVFLAFDRSGDWLVTLLNDLLPPSDADSALASAPEHKHDPVSFEEWKQWTVAENFTFGKDRGSLSMITDLNALHPYFRDKVRQLVAQCQSKGIQLAVVETFRTHAKQNEYKVMGKKYTNSGGGKSKHQYGLAVDVVPMVNGKAVWDNVLLWRKIGAIGERLGLRWGGRWKHPYDPGHFEWTGGLTSVSLAAGQLPLVPPAKYPCIEEDIIALREYWNQWESFQSATTRK